MNVIIAFLICVIRAHLWLPSFPLGGIHRLSHILSREILCRTHD